MSTYKMRGSEYIGSTAGLNCTLPKSSKPTLIKIEFYRNSDSSVTLQPVSGWSLSKISHSTTISNTEFSTRPVNVYNCITEAIWAMQRCGLTVCGADFDEDGIVY
jgi:hypothetical protein